MSSADGDPGRGDARRTAIARNVPLGDFLERVANARPEMGATAALLRELAKAAIQVAEVVSLGYIAGAPGDTVGATDSDGDAQKRLDITANEIFVNALRHAPVAAVLSEEVNSPLCLDPDAPLAVAIDPLDGSSNIDANVSIGTIIAVFPALARATEPANHFLRPGREQIAAGFVIYGPQTSLVFTIGDGVQVFALDRRAGAFQMTISETRDSARFA